MYKLLIVLIVFLNYNQSVECSFLDFIADQLADIRDTFAFALESITHHVIKIFTTKPSVKTKAPKIRKPHLKKINYSSFVPINSQAFRLANAHGRTLEAHAVQTLDGYVLALHRVSPNVTEKRSRTHRRRTILLHHGLLGSSVDWLLLGRAKSLPYLLSDAGYDVWLANARGNLYSRAHLTKNTSSREYWSFSFQEMGEYDLPAILHYITKVVDSHEPIDYVAHSMGATALLVLLSQKPEYNRFFRSSILLAPLAIMNNTRGPLKTWLADGTSKMSKSDLGTGEYMPSRRVPSWLENQFCDGISTLCKNSLFFITGNLLQEDSLSAQFVGRLLYFVPAGGSTDTILHYAQLIKHKKFHKFGNEYAEFRLKHVTVPTIIFSSTDDWLSTVSDNKVLYETLGNSIGHTILKNKNFSHTEFVWGYHADQLIFAKIIEFIKNGPELNKVPIY